MPTEKELRELLDINERRLHQLKKQEASFGAHTPAHISMEIDEVEAEIRKLRQQLGLPEQVVEPPPAQAPAPIRPEIPQQTQTVPDRQAEIRPSPQQPVSEKSGSKWWIPVVVALIGLAGVVFATVWNNYPPSVEPSQEEMQPVEFTYEAHVVSAMGESLPDAHIIIQVAGRAPLDEFTDSNGFARFFIDGSYAREPAHLIVEREGFHPHNQAIDLYPDGLPDKIPLEPIEP